MIVTDTLAVVQDNRSEEHLFQVLRLTFTETIDVGQLSAAAMDPP